MTPLQNYQQQVKEKGFQNDPAQEKAMHFLQHIYDDLLVTSYRGKYKAGVRGLYLWGSVGAGKTWLMDLFYQSLTDVKKLRLHFHHFMQLVHKELKQWQGHANPLKKVAQHFAQQARVICLDEFLVMDIADAMILANLLEALFAENITLITTANVEPDALYRNGLQRARFLPAIALLKKHLEVVHLCSQQDYRQRGQQTSGAYFCPLNEYTQQQMRELFIKYSGGAAIQAGSLLVEGRLISTVALAGKVIWFDFQDLCQVPRSQLDYLEISHRFDMVFLSNVPQIHLEQHNSARYLINLVDVFYDAGTKLIISAAVPLMELYPHGLLVFEFQRTCSRLLEMQSKEYLERKGAT